MLYTLLLHGVGTPLLQEHVAGIVQQELQGNVYIFDHIGFLLFIPNRLLNRLKFPEFIFMINLG